MKNLIVQSICVLFLFTCLQTFAQDKGVIAPTCSQVLSLKLAGASLHNPDHSSSTQAAISYETDGSIRLIAHDDIADTELQWLKLQPFIGYPTGSIVNVAVTYSVLPSPNYPQPNCYISQTRLIRNATPTSGLVVIDDATNLTGASQTHTTPTTNIACGTDNKQVMFRLVMKRGDVIKIHKVIVNFKCPANPCDLVSAQPKIAYGGKETYVIENVKYLRHKIPVQNTANISNDLFTAAPTLPACGTNTNSARTWVDIYDQNNQRLYGFCSLASSADLKDIWFGLPIKAKSPSRVMIKMTDRLCNKVYTSNWISIP